MKIEIKNRWTGEVIYSHDAENNSIKLTVEKAVEVGANLYGARLVVANLVGARLDGANLYGANLYGARLDGASLDGASLDGANLVGARLDGASLDGANLVGARLDRANLYGANLYGANLYGANLVGARLDGAKNIPHIPLACPSDGAFIGWKKASGMLVKLEIPEDARRSSATTRKCRCDKAKVLGIYNLDGTLSDRTEVESDHSDANDNYLIYKVGEIVVPDDFDENRWNECSNGIHFFINRQEAAWY